MIDENGDRLDLAGLWYGTVATNEDPEHIGRIRARVPGLFEPAGPWLEPLLPGSGPGVGTWAVPPAGAAVAVALGGGGRSTERGWYIPSGWRTVGERPTELDGDPSVYAAVSDRYLIVMDPRAESAGASIRDRVRGDVVRLDGTDLSIVIQATSAVRITAGGSVDISAPLVTIQGRPVLRSGSKPI